MGATDEDRLLYKFSRCFMCFKFSNTSHHDMRGILYEIAFIKGSILKFIEDPLVYATGFLVLLGSIRGTTSDEDVLSKCNYVLLRKR